MRAKTLSEGVFHQLARDTKRLDAYFRCHGSDADHHHHDHPDDYPGAGARGLSLSACRPVWGGAVFFP